MEVIIAKGDWVAFISGGLKTLTFFTEEEILRQFPDWSRKCFIKINLSDICTAKCPKCFATFPNKKIGKKHLCSHCKTEFIVTTKQE